LLYQRLPLDQDISQPVDFNTVVRVNTIFNLNRSEDVLGVLDVDVVSRLNLLGDGLVGFVKRNNTEVILVVNDEEAHRNFLLFGQVHYDFS